MTKLSKRLAVLVGVLAGIAFALFVYPAPLSNVKSHFAGTCRAVPMAAGAADISIDGARGIAYVSYLDRAQSSAGKQPRGTVMLVDLNVAEPRVRAALNSDPPDFRPIGLNLYIPPQGARRLFVINRGAGGSSTIEIFEQTATGAFALSKTLRDPLLTSPTAIVAVGPEQFYATNDSSAPRGFERLRQLLFPSSQSTVVYYDGTRMTTAATGLQMAAGIASSADGRAIYVSEMAGKRLGVFDRDASSGALRAREVVALGSAPENLTIDGAGNVWIAAHPRLIAAVRRLGDAAVIAPTQVLKFSPKAAAGARLSEVYVDGGEQLSAGSVAATHGKKLVIGAADDSRLLLCESTK
jgi:arylesterase/paraoxonase